MTDLNELFKVIAEGKKQYEDTDPIGQQIKQAKEHVKEDLSSLFSQLSSLKEDLEKELVVEEAKLVSLIDSDSIKRDAKNIVNEVFGQIKKPMITEEIPAQPIIHTPEVRAKQVDADVDKYLTDKSFQQPNPDLVTKNIDDIRNKIKFLEQAIGRVAAAGPGGGEVNLRYLDDVDRSTITDGWYLRYSATKKKFEFAEVISSGGNGATGAAGATGVTGSSGAQGASGLNGSTGPSGASGVSGATGSNGASGTTGSSGAQGATGIQGASGTNGASGASGSNGIDGATGISGASGINGATGIGGASGVAGTNGATGINGSSGATGTQGASGISGASGFVGSNGATGIQGASGSTGIAGASGAQGASGSTGLTGATGPAVSLGPINYAQSFGASGWPAATGASGAVFSSAAFTGNGGPLEVTVHGDANPLGTGGWARLRVYRDTTALGIPIMVESSAGNENVPYCINLIDNPGAGTFTYTLRILESPSSMQMGESGTGVWTIKELSNVRGATGAAGATGIQGASGVAGNNGATGTVGTNGATGVSGASGVNGSTGIQGSSGVQGASGIQGASGATGSAGTNGSTGVQGASGSTGLTGATGPTSATAVLKTTGSWTVTAGSGTYSFTVPPNGTYQLWVNGNIPNGIVAYNATVTVTNTNVPVVGNQYAWYYLAGNALVFTSIPSQVVGTNNSIITTITGGTTNNIFTFGITNNSGTSQTVNYGYTTIS